MRLVLQLSNVHIYDRQCLREKGEANDCQLATFQQLFHEKLNS